MTGENKPLSAEQVTEMTAGMKSDQVFVMHIEGNKYRIGLPGGGIGSVHEVSPEGIEALKERGVTVRESAPRTPEQLAAIAAVRANRVAEENREKAPLNASEVSSVLEKLRGDPEVKYVGGDEYVIRGTDERGPGHRYHLLPEAIGKIHQLEIPIENEPNRNTRQPLIGGTTPDGLVARSFNFGGAKAIVPQDQAPQIGQSIDDAIAMEQANPSHKPTPQAQANMEKWGKPTGNHTAGGLATVIKGIKLQADSQTVSPVFANAVSQMPFDAMGTAIVRDAAAAATPVVSNARTEVPAAAPKPVTMGQPTDMSDFAVVANAISQAQHGSKATGKGTLNEEQATRALNNISAEASKAGGAARLHEMAEEVRQTGNLHNLGELSSPKTPNAKSSGQGQVAAR